VTQIGKQPPRHRFILNPYPEERFAFCPECNGRTEPRKFRHFSLNTTTTSRDSTSLLPGRGFCLTSLEDFG
jgi:hypothetical protein